MFDLKPLTKPGIPAALEKASRYRLLNEPEQAESICEDVLQIESENQEALAMLILSFTDRFYGSHPVRPQQVKPLLSRLVREYDREFLSGIIDEREGIAWLRSDKPHRGKVAYDRFRHAMDHYEKAEALRPPANDDALLRWNSCVRMIRHLPDVNQAEDAVEIPIQMGD